MEKTRDLRALRLARETLRELSGERLQAVAGGLTQLDLICGTTTCTNIRCLSGALLCISQAQTCNLSLPPQCTL